MLTVTYMCQPLVIYRAGTSWGGHRLLVLQHWTHVGTCSGVARRKLGSQSFQIALTKKGERER